MYKDIIYLLIDHFLIHINMLIITILLNIHNFEYHKKQVIAVTKQHLFLNLIEYKIYQTSSLKQQLPNNFRNFLDQKHEFI